MAAPTDSELLDAYKSALLAISSGQAYTINGRTLTRANLNDVIKTIDWLNRKIGQADVSVDQTGTGILLARF